MASSLTCLFLGLASELLTNRYSLHEAKEREGLLAKHELGVLEEARAMLAGMPGGHRSREFDRHILPTYGGLVEAIGQRIAYEAGKCLSLEPAILGYFEISCIASDPGWYIENTTLTRSEISDRQVWALENVLPLLPQLLDESAVKDYVTAAIVDEKATEEYIMGWPTFEHAVRQTLHDERDKAKL